MNKTLIVVAGPTASGKTALAINLARRYDTEIISADSRQFYREMSIGTAKPSTDELAAAKHHFIDSHSVTEPFSVGDFEREGLQILDEIFKKKDVAIMAGGSGLYVRAICEGFDDLPTSDPAVREQLNQQLEDHGIEFLQEKLKAADPEYYKEVDLSNPQRIIRALEVFETTGMPYSSYRKKRINSRPFNISKYAINLPRPVLYQRIDSRVDEMVKQGLLDEVRALIPYRQCNALNTVGYSELFDYFDGKADKESAITLIKQHTRNFAKRQLTWFRRDQAIRWIEPSFNGAFLQIMH